MAELRTLLERDESFLPAQAAWVRVLLDAGREREALVVLPRLLERLEHEEPSALWESSA